jgi:hypothetical protein
LEQLHDKLAGVSSSLSTWGKETFGSVRHQIRTLQRELGDMRSQPGRTGPTYEELKLVEKLSEVLHREEIMWRQRSRIQWLAEGDKNMRFFHLRASQRKKKNQISNLVKPDGLTTMDDLEMGNAANAFYQDLYRSKGVSEMEGVLRCVPKRVGPEMNRKLDALFVASEVKTALFEMYPTKAPGPDRFPAHFFSVIGMCVGKK